MRDSQKNVLWFGCVPESQDGIHYSWDPSDLLRYVDELMLEGMDTMFQLWAVNLDDGYAVPEDLRSDEGMLAVEKVLAEVHKDSSEFYERGWWLETNSRHLLDELVTEVYSVR